MTRGIAFLLLTVIAFPGCVYLRDRGRDLADVFTASVETRNVGASLQLFNMGLGVGWSDGDGFGLRSGSFGPYRHRELSVLVVGGKQLEPRSDPRGKGYSMAYLSWPSFFSSEDCDCDSGCDCACQGDCRSSCRCHLRLSWTPLDEDEDYDEWESDMWIESRAPIRWQVEISAGLWVGARLGLNFGELVDFLLGFGTVDLWDDDEESARSYRAHLEMMEKREKLIQDQKAGEEEDGTGPE